MDVGGNCLQSLHWMNGAPPHDKKEVVEDIGSDGYWEWENAMRAYRMDHLHLNLGNKLGEGPATADNDSMILRDGDTYVRMHIPVHGEDNILHNDHSNEQGNRNYEREWAKMAEVSRRIAWGRMERLGRNGEDLGA